MTFDFSKLKKHWVQQEEARKERSAQRKSALLNKGIPILQKYGVKKVVLFGSVTYENCDPESDIDLLAIPLSAEQYWQCLRELNEEVGFEVDLYTQGDDSVFVEKVLQRGEIIYET